MSTVKLTGTIVPLVTPFNADGIFQPEKMEQLIDYVCDQGADALMVTALTGEGPLLTPDETRAVWQTAMDKVAGARPVVPAIVATTTRTAVELARSAEAMGAAAVMVAPILPELYAGRSHDDVCGFYADVAAEISLPIILFNYPSLTGVDFVPALVERLLAIGNIQYIKESTADSKRVHAFHRLFGERLNVICGAPNFALEVLALGCDVWITGLMNIVPRTAQQLMQAVRLGDLTLARRIYYRQMLPFVDVMARNCNPTGTIKAGVQARGVEVGPPRRPGSAVSAADYRLIQSLSDRIVGEEQDVAALLAGYGERL